MTTITTSADQLAIAKMFLRTIETITESTERCTSSKVSIAPHNSAQPTIALHCNQNDYELAADVIQQTQTRDFKGFKRIEDDV